MKMQMNNQFYINGSDGMQRIAFMNGQNTNNNNNSPYYHYKHAGATATATRYHQHNMQNYYHSYGHHYHQEIGEKKLVPLDGIQSGVPTRTTPTLTPTTLRNIEQTLLDWSNDVDRPVSTPYQAGFVPPLAPCHFVDSNDNNSMGSSESGSQNSWHTPVMHEENSLALTDSSSVATIYNANSSPSLPIATSTASVATTMPQVSISGPPTTIGTTNLSTQKQSRRNTGGRRPNKPSNLTPEEEEKRKIRRERNKLAAARCRKRRVDQTNELIEKVDQLEKEKQGLQQKIEELKTAADELEMCLQSHQPTCKLLSSGIAMAAPPQQPQPPPQQNHRLSPCDVKPIINFKDEFIDVKSIKTEPLDSMVDSLDGPPSPKRILLTTAAAVGTTTASIAQPTTINNNKINNNQTSSIIPPLPTVSTIASTIAAATSILNTPTITTPPPIIATTKPNRPSSLNVPLTITPSQALGLTKTMTDITGVPITTPSSGVTFNFDSLMDGGTGLTPVTAPLMPTCSSQNKHPLELVTPTSEPSKLVSL